MCTFSNLEMISVEEARLPTDPLEAFKDKARKHLVIIMHQLFWSSFFTRQNSILLDLLVCSSYTGQRATFLPPSHAQKFKIPQQHSQGGQKPMLPPPFSRIFFVIL